MGDSKLCADLCGTKEVTLFEAVSSAEYYMKHLWTGTGVLKVNRIPNQVTRLQTRFGVPAVICGWALCSVNCLNMSQFVQYQIKK